MERIDMKYVVERKNKQPAYMQLYYQLRRDIESEAYLYGQKLPSKRMLAEETGTSVVPIEHAYALLCEEGYVEARERSGYVVIYKSSDFLSHSSESEEERKGNHNKPEHSYHGNFPFFTISKTMRRVLLDYGESIFQKSDNQGCLELRQAVSKYLNRSIGIEAEPEQIVIGAGAEYLYSLVAQLLGNDRIYALENPCYNKIQKVYEAHGVTCEQLALGSKGIKSSELQRSRAGILHITPFNSFPSHITADASKRREYMEWVTDRDGYLIEDNYESELTVSKKNEETIFSQSKDGRVIYLNTFSRTVSPSLRVGYMVLPKHLVALYKEKLGFYSCTASVFEQYVLTDLINSGEFERNINRIRRTKRRMETQCGNIK